MKLFLSSAGISNKTLAKAFIGLTGLKKDKIKVEYAESENWQAWRESNPQ